MSNSNIRNFCIIAHIDHGKSTLADRMLEITNTVDKRKMYQQYLDQMELEQERGITIKLQPVRMDYKGYVLNLIDTPGHVDFSYEVSRSLAAVEGAILLVDATQGIQAQTIANLYLALEQNLMIIPVINKIDLPAADPEGVTNEIVNLIGCDPKDILRVSAKTGENVAAVLDRVIEKVPLPQVDRDQPLRALIFDSIYDEYRGVVAYVRIMDGRLKKGENIKMLGTNSDEEALEVGYFRPQYVPASELTAGEIGYIVTDLREVSQCRVGDTVAIAKNSDVIPLKGYKEVKPMVFAGVFCKEGDEYSKLREAIEKLKLNDASLTYEPENSPALGFGFRCGFLGLLHLEIFQERLRREYNLDLMVTTPSVAYKVYCRGREKEEGKIIKSPEELPDAGSIDRVEEPIMKVDVVTPKDYLGAIMQMIQEKNGGYKTTEYLDANRAILHYDVPLANLIVDFYDKIKSLSAGYASMNYEFGGYRSCDVVKMDIVVAGEPIEALSIIIYRDDAYSAGKKIVESLKKVLPRQMFEVKIQACVGAKIIASERIPAMRKDVTAKLYGGDLTRKRKLLEKQKKGKKKMKVFGKVDIPPEAFVAVLKR